MSRRYVEELTGRSLADFAGRDEPEIICLPNEIYLPDGVLQAF